MYSLKPGFNFRLGNHIYLITDFRNTNYTDNFIYVDQKLSVTDLRYILARIKQETYNFTFRFNYNFTPDLSVQYYGSPFISNGKYHDFKYATDPHSTDITKRCYTYGISEISYDEPTNTYNVDEGSSGYFFRNPDFSFRQFRSNLVIRWEYRPGSTLYLVWENNRNSRDGLYIPSFSENLDELFSVVPTNIFMLKINFWLGL
jgi:hypothetical protein